MKYLVIILALSLSLFACKKKDTTSTIPGVNLSSKTAIAGYNALTPELNEPLEVYDDAGKYQAVILVLLGPTSSWQGWRITKGLKGYRISPNEFPTQALDITMLDGAGENVPNLSTYTDANRSKYEFVFEDAGAPDVYYIKSAEGKYLQIDFVSNKSTFVTAKPVETVSVVSRFTIK